MPFRLCAVYTDARLYCCKLGVALYTWSQTFEFLTSPLGGTGDLMVKTRALNLVSQGSSLTSVRAFFSLSLC